MKSFLRRTGLLYLLILLSPIISYAEIYSGSCGQDVVWKLDTETGLLEIYNRQPGAYSYMDSYISDPVPWYSYTKHIRSVNLSGISNIGSYAFYNCSSLTSVSIPESVTSIGEYAFYRCSGLTSITIPESVTSIGYSAFLYCSGLTSITIPESVTSIGSYVFCGCSGLNTIIVKQGNPKYDSRDDCNAIIETNTNTLLWGCNTTTIPESVTSIGNYAFYDCSGLTSITIPKGVTSMGESAFRGCSGLTSITIPESVTSVGYEAFRGCSGLTSITIPESVTQIMDYTFSGCSGLTSVTIPESVNSIGSTAFASCNNLTSVTINSNAITSATYSSTKNIGTIFGAQVKEYIIGGSKIGDYAFYNCSGLESITIPESVTSIGSSAFRNCSGLTSITIPEGVTSIGSSAFSGCSGLTAITIPEGVTSIGSSAFSSCSGLNTIIVKQGNPKYDSRDDCNAIIETNTNTLLWGCNTTTIPEGVTSIGSSAFSSCSGLTSITIPGKVTSIEISAFSGCSNLTSVILNSNAITSATYSSSNNIGTIFGSQVKNYIIGDKVKRIGEQAFASSREVVSIDLGRNIERIQDYAFGGCDKLEEVRVKASEPPIAFSTAFPDNAYYAFLYVPEGTEALYKEDNVWGKFARIRTFKDEPEKCVLSIKSAIGGYLEMICNTQTNYTFRIITEKGWQVSSVSFNGADVTANITDDSYTTPLLEGDSELSVIFEMDQDEIDMVNEVETHSQLSVTASASTIYIHNEGAPVNSYIYTSDGKMVNSVVASYGKTTIPLQPNNIYLVKTDTRTFKVAL